MLGGALAWCWLAALAGQAWPGTDGLAADLPPSLPYAPAAAPTLDERGAALLAAALTARERGDGVQTERLLRGWATLGGRPPPPPALAAAAAEALTWSTGSGAFRLFASRHGDRVRIGVVDPAALGVRIEATARSADRAMTLARAEAETPGRIEHVLDPAFAGDDVRVELRAWCDALEPPLLLHRLVVGGAADPAPVAPDPSSLRGVPEALRAPAPAVVATEATTWPWWWFAAGGLALGLAGAAIWQETQP